MFVHLTAYTGLQSGLFPLALVGRSLRRRLRPENKEPPGRRTCCNGPKAKRFCFVRHATLVLT